MGRRPTARPYRLAFILALALLALNVALAAAQDTAPPNSRDAYDDLQDSIETVEPTPGVMAPDTDTTPKYTGPGKDGSGTWKQLEGALFRNADDPARAEQTIGGATTYNDNLFDVAFRNPKRGLAGGATCENPDPDAKPEEQRCKPALFSFRDTPQAGPVWSRVDLPGGDEPGYIGAIAWLDARRALIVGGTGVYPRREPKYQGACQTGDHFDPWGVKCDPAGMGRAWLLQDGNLCELQVGIENGFCPALPRDDPATTRFEGVRGLTAVGFRADPDWEIGFVGGLGQIWRWTGDAGGFDKLYDNRSPESDLDQPATNVGEPMRRIFRFRVRDLRFAPTISIRAYAVTSGCCSEHDTTDHAQLLTYSEWNGSITIPGHWFLRSAEINDSGGSFLTPITPGDPGGTSRSLREEGVPAPHPPATNDDDFTGTGATRGRPHQSGAGRAESLYSLSTTLAANFLGPTLSVLITTASPDSAVEVRSVIKRCAAGTQQTENTPPGDTIAPLGGSARLLAIDGTTPGESCKAGPEWAVGELRSRIAPGRGRRGLVLSAETAERRRKPPYYEPPLTDPGQLASGYQPTDEERVRQHLRARDQLVTSYTLNSLDMVADEGPATLNETGIGWAVGDHGAILKLDPGTADQELAIAKAEPEPPRLGAGQRRTLASSTPYDPLRPPPAKPGQVPPLATQPVLSLRRPLMVSMGSPDAMHIPQTTAETEDVAEIVMSRDGKEGWAVGTAPHVSQQGSSPISSYGTLSLYHYDGSGWSRCDPVGIKGQLAADPACAGLAPLRRFMTIGGTGGPEPKTVKLIGAARIPYERDDEPDNDDDFEVVAIGTSYLHPGDRAETPVVARYQHGRWRIDHSLRELMARVAASGVSKGAPVLRDIVFTAPDDGWVLASHAWSTSRYDWHLYHWNGSEWSVCAGGAAGCGAERVPRDTSRGAILGLAAAGDRVYLYGWRFPDVTEDKPLDPTGGGLGPAGDQVFNVLETPRRTAQGVNAAPLPLILYHERGKPGWHGGADTAAYDPGYRDPSASEQGKVVSLSVAQGRDGRYTGWAVGRFYRYRVPPDTAVGNTSAAPGQHNQGSQSTFEPTAVLMRLSGPKGQERWAYFRDPGSLQDLMNPVTTPGPSNRELTEPQMQLTLPAGDGRPDRAFIAQRLQNNLFSFNTDRERFEVVDPGRPPTGVPGVAAHGIYQALASDQRGGVWAAVKTASAESIASVGGQVWFYNYTDRPRKPVFSEAPQPFGDLPELVTSLAGAADGTLWAATDQGRLAHYDRALGWETMAIPGWDPGRVVTRRSEVYAVAVNPDGAGIAVGKMGRIANLDPAGVTLDTAAAVRCAHPTPEPPCGTGYDLHAAAVSPEGDAMAGGSALTVVHRPAGEEFMRVERPPGNSGNRITGIAFPTPDRAWLTSDAGYVYSGTRSGRRWHWTIENVKDDEIVGGRPLRAIAVDANGHGYAVGDRGTVLERTGDPASPWQLRRGPGRDNLTAVTLGPDGHGALAGGRSGVIWTLSGERFELARPADYARGASDDAGAGGGVAVAGARSPDLGDTRGITGPTTGTVVGLALLPGTRDAQVEAWAASEARGRGTNRLFHYASDPDEPLLRPDRRAEPLPDAPAPRAGELAFAAFGNMGCAARSICSVRRGSRERREVIAARIVDELRDRVEKPGAPAFSLFTGDTASSGGLAGSAVYRSDRLGTIGQQNVVTGTPGTDIYGTPEMADAPTAQRQWGRLVADPLDDAGLPLFGSVGAGDLTRPLYRCDGTGCEAWGEEAKSGDNLTWRDTMEARRAPWGKAAAAPPATGLVFEPVRGSDEEATGAPSQRVDPDGEGPLPIAELKAGARTHYALDVKRAGEPVARLVVVDSSLRSLQGSDPMQQPIESKGQLAWLERMACVKGSVAPSTGSCTRERDQSLIVLTNTPTYSYRGDTAESNAVDGVQMEEALMRHRATVVVSGRHNASLRYWAAAPGVHEPCPGGSYQDTPPPPGTRVCGRGPNDQASATVSRNVGAVLRGLGAPAAPDEAVGEAAGGILPFVVAATAGGPFGTSDLGGEREAAQGYWNGYTVVRVPADGDPTGVIVEQRPIFDWLSISGSTHTLRPGQRLVLRGEGREPVGYASSEMTRFDRIDSPAITHRYDLVEADPEQPWLPKVVAGNGNPHGYVPLDPAVGTVDPQSGRIVAGRGTRGRVYAVALLSVGAQSATWPVVFEPRRSFTPPTPRKLTIPPALPPIRVLGIPAQAVPSQPPPVPPATPPIAVDLVLPPPPAIPGLPGGTPTPIAPPIPPVTPPPPASVGQTATGLAANPLAILLAPTAAPIPPSSPLIQPAPPSGARREARQKQAATAKSEEGASPAQDNGGDLADKPIGPQASAMTRRARSAPAPVGFTPRARASQPSAWVTGLQYGGGTALMALVLALGWTTARPTPRGRRREDVDPAPAWLRDRR